MPEPVGPPDKTKTLDHSHFNPESWDAAVSDLYEQGYSYFFTVGPWVTFGGYEEPKAEHRAKKHK